MVLLQSYGVGTARAVRIYKTYGDQAIDLVKSNPYRLASDVWGFGFRTADELAIRLGLDRASPLRARAALRYVLQELASKGHVGYPESGVVEAAVNQTQIAPDIVRAAVEAERAEGEIVRDTPPADEAVEGEPEPWLFLKPLFLAELGVARAGHRLR